MTYKVVFSNLKHGATFNVHPMYVLAHLLYILYHLQELKIFEANMEFVKKALIRIGRHYNVTYGKWIMDEGTWSEFVPQAEAERKIIVAKYGQ